MQLPSPTFHGGRFLSCTIGAVLGVVLSVAALPAAASPAAPLPAFPGARGFGSTTVGGSGRHLTPPKTKVITVTSLAESGAGTLRECVETSGPRTCLFEVGGAIELQRALKIDSPYLTIAGQTAPEPGITLFGAGIVVATHDVLIQHLAIRVGDRVAGPRPNARDGVTIHGKEQAAYNIVLDHLSVAWALDENVSTYGDNVHDVTFSNSIFSEGLYHSIHPDGPHSMGMLIGEGSARISVHHCLFAHNNDRNPRQKAGTSLEFINNLVYNWGGRSGAHMANPADTDRTHAETLLNFAGNYYLAGPNSPRTAPIFGKPLSDRLRIYVGKNYGPTRESETKPEWKIAGIPERPYRSTTPAFPLSGVSESSPTTSYEEVLRSAGSRPSQRNTVDARIIAELKSESGMIKDCVEGCERPAGGWPKLQQTRTPLQLPAHPFSDSNRNGYTDLEDWIHSR